MEGAPSVASGVVWPPDADGAWSWCALVPAGAAGASSSAGPARTEDYYLPLSILRHDEAEDVPRLRGPMCGGRQVCGL